MRKLLLLFSLMFLFACGRSEVYDMKFLDFKAKYDNASKKALELTDKEWELYKGETDPDKKQNYLDEFNDKYNDIMSDEIGITDEELKLLDQARERLKTKEPKRLIESTIGELIDTQKQINGE